MKLSSLRELSLVVGFGLALAACGDRSAQLPTSPQQGAPTPLSTTTHVPVAQAPVDPSGGIAYAESVGVPPTGFNMVVRVKPRPGADGVIRGESPLTVEFDLCDSTADAGKTLFYLYDWDFDNAADLVGTGAACRQEHTYKVKVQAETGDETIETNVCVVNGDPGAHAHSTFFACRNYTLAIPIPGKFCHSINALAGNNFAFLACPSGATEWCASSPISGTNKLQALKACNTCYGGGCSDVPSQNFVNSPGNQTWYAYGRFPSCPLDPAEPGAGDAFWECTASSGPISFRWAP